MDKETNATPSPTSSVTLDPNNVRTHPDRNKQAIRKSLEKFGAGRSVVVDKDNEVRAGNGTVEQAEALGLTVKVVDAKPDELIAVRRKDWTAEQAQAYAIADNRTGELAEWDEDELYKQLGELQEWEPDIIEALEFDLTDVEFHLRRLNTEETLDDGDNQYTNKVVAPVYEPKGERPPLSALVDRSKTEELVEGIVEADLPDDVKDFLLLAAERHTVFNFRQVAEFYCHADDTLQDLMERSGLIIIDFDKAIENGFVHLTERLCALADVEEHGDA